jgi:Mn2+/Fe2+ NRAMP family transporter
MSASSTPKARATALLGAAFLMATSAIGPGFITQTTVFTERLNTSFAFVILCSIIIDLIVQLNIWRIVSVSEMPAQELANRTVPGSGYVLSFLIVLGGLAFNTGNLAGAGMGIQVLTGAGVHYGVVISVVIALFIFWNREIGKALDLFAKVLGVVMILLTAYIAFASRPPVVTALRHAIFPQTVDMGAIIVLVGGTVGGYISFAGVHRLLDAGIKGPQNIGAVSTASTKAILIAAAMRVLLFFAALGVVTAGGHLRPDNPAASVFSLAAGDIGYYIFGVVLWAASITSVVGSAYTSVSFMRGFHPAFKNREKLLLTIFVLISAVIFLLVGRPVVILIVVGALNVFILPIALAVILIASRKKVMTDVYKHPFWMQVAGWLVVAALAVMSVKVVADQFGQ